MDLLKKFQQYIQQENLFQQKDRLLLAVSGGVDSVVLCELCKRAGYNFEIAHCNFQLRGEDSSRDEQFVKKLAQRYGVEFHFKTFDTLAHATAAKKSVEEAARDLRYEWFYALVNDLQVASVQEGEKGNSASIVHYILTGHHADDNIETVLMNFFRGTGITGLRGILPKQGKIVRPLLFARRSELEKFITENGLDFVSDYTNLENDYTRNYFRNTIIPLVSESYPEATKNIMNNIRRFRETEILYQQAVLVHKKRLLEQKGMEVHIPLLKLLKTVPVSTILYEIIRDYGFTAHQTDDAVALLKSGTGKYITSPTHRLIKNRNWLIIAPIKAGEADHILIEESDQGVNFRNGSISFEKIAGQQLLMVSDPLTAQLDMMQIKFPLLLRKWKQGDYFYPLGMQKKKKLSRFFIDQKLSLTQKENTWVIEMDRKIIWVVGMRIDNRFKIIPSTQQIYSLKLLSRTGN